MKPQFFKRTNFSDRTPETTSLSDIFLEYGGDKADVEDHHPQMLKWHMKLPYCHTVGYATLYATLFDEFKHDAFKMLEIGICDNRHPFASPRTYLRYFPRVDYWGYDLFTQGPKDSEGNIQLRMPDILDLVSRGANIIYGNQYDKDCLTETMQEITKDGNLLRLVIDDGSHISKHIWTSLEIIWPYLESGGLYVIEDLTSGHPWPLKDLLYGDYSQDVWRAFYMAAKAIDPMYVNFDAKKENGETIEIPYTDSTEISTYGSTIMNKVLDESNGLFFRPGRDYTNFVGVLRKK